MPYNIIIGVPITSILFYLNFFLLDNQQYAWFYEIFLEKPIAERGKGSTFAPAFGRELGLSEGSTGA
ncbi:MAG: hypothetical protein IKI09_04135, partial [Bacteroidales bacterium]|nr:hypothetical protein [Bacteroidales bacterium]